MDFVVHINDGSEAVRPIVLSVLPGEEATFNLRIVNHGEPSNVTLSSSDPSVLLMSRPDRYVVMEETVPVRATIPPRKARLDGEILLLTDRDRVSVPVCLLRSSEDPGDDLDDPSLPGEPGEADEGSYVEPDDDDESGEVRRITFSRERDLQRYRAASGHGQQEEIEGGNRMPEGRGQEESASEPEQPTDSYEEHTEILSPVHIIPGLILLLLMITLTLTFLTESLPEFPGALASSILIVTLIIYGAATLLKA